MSRGTGSGDRWELLGARWQCECGREHDVPTQRALIASGAVEETAALCHELGLAGRAFLVADETTFAVAGERVSALLERNGFSVRRHILSGRPRATVEQADAVAAAVESGDDFVISVGSGTVTDLGKWAANRNDRPQIAVATAPSMNGYASGVAALIRNGLKSTQSIRPALGVIADVEILSAAPMEMIRAGLGDVLSKPVCNADWKLAALLRGEHFCPRPAVLIRDLEQLYTEGAEGLARRDPAVIAALAEALVFSGVSMVIAGSSAPASGAEHLFSHFLDMRAGVEGGEHDFHGAQVGVGSIASARLFERLLQREAGDLDPNALADVWSRGECLAGRTRRIFGAHGDAIVEQFAGKRIDRAHAEREARTIVERWEEIRTALRPLVVSPERLAAPLVAAGAKTRFAEIGVAGDRLRDVLELAVTIRNRFTVLDVALALGELEGWVDAVLREEAQR